MSSGAERGDMRRLMPSLNGEGARGRLSTLPSAVRSRAMRPDLVHSAQPYTPLLSSSSERILSSCNNGPPPRVDPGVRRARDEKPPPVLPHATLAYRPGRSPLCRTASVASRPGRPPLAPHSRSHGYRLLVLRLTHPV